MSKLSKIFLIFSILSILLISNVDADNTTYNNSSENTVSYNNQVMQSDSDTSAIYNSTNNNSISNSNNTSNKRSSVSYITQLPESGLGVTNILNIFLIVIGVLLILFAIAILIKAK